MFARDSKPELPAEGEALPGRSEPMRVPETHFVKGTPLTPPFPREFQQAVFGLGCFWGAVSRTGPLRDLSRARP